MWLKLGNCGAQILLVQTRKKCAEKEKGDRQEVGGTETPMPPPQSLSTEKKKKRVRFQEPGHIGATKEPEDNILESSADSQGGIRGTPLNRLEGPKFSCSIFGWLIGRHNTQNAQGGDRHGKHSIMKMRHGPQGISYWRRDFTLRKNCVCAICAN